MRLMNLFSTLYDLNYSQIVMYIMILTESYTQTLVTVSSLILATGISVGNQLKLILDGIVFIFFYHSFDIGDYIVVDDKGKFIKQAAYQL